MSSYNNEYFLIFRVASDERVRFVGNVSLGSDISTQELRNAYDAVVLGTIHILRQHIFKVFFGHSYQSTTLTNDQK